MGGAEARADDGAPVAALGTVALVAELGGHEVVEGVGYAGGAPAALLRFAAPAEAGDGGDDDVEGVGGVAAVGGGVGEGPDELEELKHRAGPAVREEQGMGVRPLAADVPVVDVDAVDLAEELGPGVERGLLGAPVVLVAPVVAELADVLRRRRRSPSRCRGWRRASGCGRGGREGRRGRCRGRRCGRVVEAWGDYREGCWLLAIGCWWERGMG